MEIISETKKENLYKNVNKKFTFLFLVPLKHVNGKRIAVLTKHLHV